LVHTLEPFIEGPRVEIAQAILVSPNGLILQLRDFKPVIADPGRWGCFAGRIEPIEHPVEAVQREVREETSLNLSGFESIGVFDILDRRMYVFHKQLIVDDENFSLNEGSDWGAYSIDQILKGNLFSERFANSFPLTTISNAVIRWLHQRDPSCLIYRKSNAPNDANY